MHGLCALIDCKTLENKTGKFPISRIEENQRLAYKKWKECHNSNYFLSILWNNDVYYIDLESVNFNEKSIDLKEYSPNVEDFYENFG